MMQLSVRLVPIDDTTLVIALTGELDSTTKPVLAAFLDPLPQTPVKRVVVAAGDLWFCDLNGLELLARTHRALRGSGGHLALAEPRPSLHRLVALMAERSTEPIPVFASMPEALAAAGVEEYRTDEPSVGRRHLPRLRAVPGAHAGGKERHRSRRRTSPADPSGPAPHPPAPQAEPDTSGLPTAIYRSRTLRERALNQQQALNDGLTRTTEARTRLLSARRRCDDSLLALRHSLSEARSILTRDEPVPPPAP
ncbi:STAS domain-containing protein [Nonomuraea sp. NPDC004297]